MTQAQNGVFWKILAHTSPHIYLRARRRAGGAAGGCPRGAGPGPDSHPGVRPFVGGRAAGAFRWSPRGVGQMVQAQGRADEEAPGGVANRVVLWCKGGCNEITTGNPGLTLVHSSRWLPGYPVPAHGSPLIRAALPVRPGSGFAPGALLQSQHQPGDRGGGRDLSRDPRHQEDSGQDPGRPENRHHCLPGLRHVPPIQRPGHFLLPSRSAPSTPQR